MKIQFIIDDSRSMKIWDDQIFRITESFLNVGNEYVKNIIVLDNVFLNDFSKDLIIPDVIYIIITDYVGSFWGTLESYSFLETLSENNYTSIINVLPSRIYKRTSLEDTYLVKFITNTNKSNTGLVSDIDDFFLTETDFVDSLRIPMMNVDNISSKNWFLSYLGKKDCWLFGIVIPKEEIVEETESTNDKKNTTLQIIQYFNVSVPPSGRKLAYYLSIMDVFSLDIMKFFADELVPDASRLDLAEVFLNGLLIKKDSDSDVQLYQFKPGVQKMLFDNLTSEFARYFTANYKEELILKMKPYGLTPSFFL